jgi:hypothetical protein
MADYRLGTGAPRITPDVGAGAWRSVRPSVQVIAQHQALTSALGSNWATRLNPLTGPPTTISRQVIIATVGDDAVAHMDHYFGNTGRDLTIDLEGMLHENPNAAEVYGAEVAEAMRFVEGLPVGVHDITSGATRGGYNHKHQSTNWFFAVGGYSVWGTGRAVVDVRAEQRTYTLDYAFHFFDRNNWDNGKEVTLPYVNIVITDRFMGDFHRAGLAREFDMRGTIQRRLLWRAGEFTSPPNLDHGRAPTR